MDAQTQMLFCLMLFNNSFHVAKLPRSKTKKKKKSRHANIEQMKFGKTYVSDLLDLVCPCVCMCVRV